MSAGLRHHLRVFLSSPRDVAEEREAVVRLVKDKLPYDDLVRGLVTFEVLAWDDRAQRVALLAGESGQASVDRALGTPGACDLTVVVLWARLGTPPDDRPPKPDGTPYRSGTEWELWDALHAGKPVLVCRRLAKAQVDATNPEELGEFVRQAQLVNDFFAELATRKINVNTYTEPSEVAALVEGKLKRMVRQRLDAGRSPGVAGALIVEFTGRIQVQDDDPIPLHLPPADFAAHGSLRFSFKNRRILFRGREQELAALEDFLSHPRPFAWWLAVGSGGAGKSRLALELCLRHRDRWQAGFLEQPSTPRRWDMGTVRNWQPRQPTLIVVDYALACPKQTRDLILTLARCTDRLAQPVRVLLLERAWNTWLEQQLYPSSSDRGEMEAKLYPGSPLAPLIIAALSDDDVWELAREFRPRHRRRTRQPEHGSCRVLRAPRSHRPTASGPVRDDPCRGARARRCSSTIRRSGKGAPRLVAARPRQSLAPH